jgi:hypothetical protein
LRCCREEQDEECHGCFRLLDWQHIQVKVAEDIKVYHIPGFKTGIDLKGKVGIIEANVTMFKGTKLSPNFPWKVKFEVEGKGGKPKPFFVHLV